MSEEVLTEFGLIHRDLGVPAVFSSISECRDTLLPFNLPYVTVPDMTENKISMRQSNPYRTFGDSVLPIDWKCYK